MKSRVTVFLYGNSITMDINKRVAAKIKRLRLEKNITLDAMAKDLGMSRTSMSQLENGKVKLHLKRLNT